MYSGLVADGEKPLIVMTPKSLLAPASHLDIEDPNTAARRILFDRTVRLSGSSASCSAAESLL